MSTSISQFLANAAGDVKSIASTIEADATGEAAKAFKAIIPSLAPILATFASDAAMVSTGAGAVVALISLGNELEKLGVKAATPEQIEAINRDKNADFPD